MHGWEWLARVAAWPVLVAGLQACRASRPAPWWRAGWVLLIAHEALALVLVHGGDHARAVEDTARQVAAATGREVSWALYANHAFTGVWGAVALAWERLPAWAVRVWIGLYLFFAFQAAVVFARGWGRWFGIALFLGWAGAVVADRQRRAPRAA